MTEEAKPKGSELSDDAVEAQLRNDALRYESPESAISPKEPEDPKKEDQGEGDPGAPEPKTDEQKKGSESKNPEADEIDDGEKDDKSESGTKATKKEESKKPESKGDKKEKAEEKGELDDDPNDTAFVKAGKDGKRRERSWNEINQRKNDVEKREKEMKRLESLNTREREVIERLSKTAEGKPRWTAEDYEDAAKDFEADGKPEHAADAREKAKALREAGDATERERTEKIVKQHRESWNANFDKLAESNPDLNDEKSPLYKATLEVLAKKPELRALKGGRGIIWAVEHAKVAVQAALVPDLQKELSKEKKRADDAEAKLEIPASTPKGGGTKRATSGTKKFEDLSEEEQEAELRRGAVAAEA